jgi:hypothetical protein
MRGNLPTDRGVLGTTAAPRSSVATPLRGAPTLVAVPVADVAALVALPRSLRLATWGSAALAGGVSLDEAVERIAGGDTLHRMVGIDGEPAEVGLSLGLGSLRAHGARALCLALPATGDPVGLAGPPGFNAEATVVGEAVLAVFDASGVPAASASRDRGRAGSPSSPAVPGLLATPELAAPSRHVASTWGCVPVVERLGSSGTAVRWNVSATAPPRLGPSLAEADHELSRSMREATEVLTGLDVARWDPAVTATVMRLREHDEREALLAPGYPARAHRVLALGRWVRALVSLARSSEGAARTAREMSARSAVLDELERGSRRAIMAACNAPLERGN